MSQLYRMPPSDISTPQSPRRSESNGAVIIGFVVACLSIVGVIGALVGTGVLNKSARSSDSQGSYALTTSVGQPLTVSNVTVTLTSATVAPNAQDTLSGQNTQVATIMLHFVNPTNTNQTVSMEQWQFLDSGGHAYPMTPASHADLTVTLAPSAALDRQVTVPMTVSGYGPYMLLTDVTTPNGGTLGWTFTG